MNAVHIATEYLQAVTAGPSALERVRQLLTDDFTLTDPLVSASSADDFIAQIRRFSGGPKMRSTILEVLGEGDRAAALTELQVGEASITYAQWFWLRDGKIARVRVVYDPRVFLR